GRGEGMGIWVTLIPHFHIKPPVTSIEYDEHKGKIAIGHLYAGVLNRDMDVPICALVDACRFGKVNELFVFQKFFRVAVESVEAGDICAVCGVVLMIFRLFMVFMDKDVLTLRPDTNLDHMQLVNIGNQNDRYWKMMQKYIGADITSMILLPLPFSSVATFVNIMCRQPLSPPLSPPSAKPMIMALEEYGYY
ncbi:putative elongation factor TypA-like SVR3, chloroplastic, partial [Tanacetum coccineum]